jgi:hypothetical protein
MNCNHSPEMVIHKGIDKTEQAINIKWDSIVIDAFNTSGQGNYFMIDSVITFADHYYARIYNYDCHTGTLLSQEFGLGNGPNELNRFFYACPVRNDTSVFIIDNSINVTFYGAQSYALERKGLLNFKWKGRYTGEYDLPEIYNFMLMTDLGGNIYNMGNDTLIIPIQPVINYACESEIITKAHFKKSHILGLLDKKTMEVVRVFGNYSSAYQKRLLPQFNFFSYLVRHDTIYVDFPVDSLIYVYKYPDKLLYTFGYECKDIDRSYTESNRIEDKIYDDFQRCGFNTELIYIPELKLFCRTYMKSGHAGSYGLQLYNHTYDLIADIHVPCHFKLIGYYDSYLYGVTLIPEETYDNTFVTFYKLKIL